MDGPDIQPAFAQGGSPHETGAADAQRGRGDYGPHLVHQLAYETRRRGIVPVVMGMRTFRETDDDERKAHQDSGQQAHAAPGSSGIDLVCHGSPSVPRIGAPPRPGTAAAAAP